MESNPLQHGLKGGWRCSSWNNNTNSTPFLFHFASILNVLSRNLVCRWVHVGVRLTERKKGGGGETETEWERERHEWVSERERERESVSQPDWQTEWERQRLYSNHWVKCFALGSRDSSVVRALDFWSKGCGFKSRQKNFLLRGQLSVLTLILVFFPPLSYCSNT